MAVPAAAVEAAVRQMRELIQREGDRREFEFSGFHCLLLRDPEGGYWCGYVGVPRGHKCYEVDSRDITDVRVHGGLEYSAAEVGAGDGRPGYWYLGFDCDHTDDICLKDFTEFDAVTFSLKRTASYKTVEFAEGEVRALAGQLKDLQADRVYH